MLDIWTQASATEVDDFCLSHASATGEKISSTGTTLLIANVCPYAQYQWERLQFAPQIVKRHVGESTISTRSISYYLHLKHGQLARHAAIPLDRTAESVAEVNKLLSFRVNRSNIVDYVLFIGHLYSSSPFYFFAKISQVATLLGGVPTDQEKSIKQTVLGVFRSPDGNSIDISIEEKKHFLLGTYFLLRLPCLYRGSLYITKLRVAEDGHINMENDDALNVQGIFDDEESLRYYPLDSAIELSQAKAEQSDRVVHLAKWSTRVLLADTVLQWLLLPLFLFTCFLILSLGIENQALVGYLRELRTSTTVTILAFALGLLGTLVAAFRFVFLEFIIYARKFIPSVWAQMADAAESQHQKAAENMGTVVFVIANAIEFLIRTAMVLSLLIYGLSAPPISLLGSGVHYGTAIAAILQSAPLIGDFLAGLAHGSSYSISAFSDFERKLLSGLVSFMLGTICIGLIGRVTKQAMTKA